jgi:rhamnosyltransferase
MTAASFQSTDGLPDLLNPRLCAIIVTYNPTQSLCGNVARLAAEVAHIFVIDNGSRGESLRYLTEVGSSVNCSCSYNEKNRGIAAALNQGVALAIKHGFTWVITFDQDSTVTGNFVSSMFECLAATQNADMVGVVGPRYVDQALGVNCDLNILPNGELAGMMTSGSLMPIRIFNDVGLFDERLFMDYVDTEFCNRIRSRGWRILQSQQTVLLHSLGKLTLHQIFGLKCSTTNHKPGRVYYIARNRLWILGRPSLSKSWLISIKKELTNIFKEASKTILFEHDRLQKLYYMVLGTVDALLGRMGKRIEL